MTFSHIKFSSFDCGRFIPAHVCNLLKGLLTMYKDGRYSDVTLKISEDRRLSAHRIVMAFFSPYFEALFGKSVIET